MNLMRYDVKKVKFDELAKEVKFPDIMKNEEGRYVPLINLGTQYKDIIAPCAEKVKYAFDTLDGAKITHQYGDEPVRKLLTDISLVKDVCDFFTDLTKGKLDTVTVTRNCPTTVDSPKRREDVRDYHWYSEIWHIDPFLDGNFKVGIYLNDVKNEKYAPFEYLDVDLNENFYHCLHGSGLNSRIFDLYNKEDIKTVKVLGEKYTTMVFSPMFIHKGNYARLNGYRDFIMLEFNH